MPSRRPPARLLCPLWRTPCHVTYLQWDFGLNWLHYVKQSNISYYAVAATDVATSEALVALGEPCFERIDEEAQKLGEAAAGWSRS